MIQYKHPTTTGPDYRDEDGFARLVKCPDCGQMEWWTALECFDHGMCRNLPDNTCLVCEEFGVDATFAMESTH